MTAPRLRSPQPKQLDAGILQAEISSFALRLAAEGKAAKTIRTYTEAVQWFAAARLPGRASWEHVDRQDIQQWMAWLLDRYSSAYASNQYRALQQFFKWLAAEDQLPDPMAGLAPPRMADKLVPVFAPGDLTRLERACAGRGFAQRRDTTIIAVLTATGIRLSELAGLRCGDLDLWQRELIVHGKGGKDRIVRIGHQAARSLDRYLRARSRHAHARRPQLWLGVNNREPLTAAGIYQMIARRGRQAGVDAGLPRMRQQPRRHLASRVSATNLRDQPSRATQPATRAEPRICPTSKSQKPLDGRLREPPEASGGPHRNPTSPVRSGPHEFPTDTTTLRGILRHSC